MVAKRMFDLALAIPLTIAFLPIFVLVGILIKLDSPGPVIFSQIRIGRQGKPFIIYKFRSMVIHAERVGSLITSGNDKRITILGRTLRKYKLDELPQLFNVLKGDMSFVGPRPEVPKYVIHYPIEVKEKILSMPPGITDLASITYRKENELLASLQAENKELDIDTIYIQEILPYKLACYQRYVEDQSLFLDLKIILLTIIAVFIKK